ncbi:uncharacterized protein J7T54_005724 [Emericellopsis cladophorae]|uniref:Uncharacterized protein n=1 Tax=Emericellopsis cladophorae TaxID=2686198 RepID=A0A9P9XXJ9_9HYPO|nr:uncharacterized protein J7T54_005724 [Emericellopsis cladophorae]KAI6779694.1 hypothetical protein J7T54_005724 [Emericellopsis cladophorae]
MSDAGQSLECKVVSPARFPLDPRYVQTRAPKVVPWYRTRHDGHGRGCTHPTSRSFLDLPDEVLWRVTHFIAEPNKGRYLSSFALASRDCRQLARPHQFADVSIVCSQSSENIVSHILQEASQQNPQVQPTIGACIRTLHLVVNRYYVPAESSPADEWTDDELDAPEPYGGWNEDRWQSLIDNLAQAMECCMSNLNRLYWDDTGGLTVVSRLVPALVSRLKTCPMFQELWFDDYHLFYGLDEVHGRPVIPGGVFRVRSLGFGRDKDARKRSGNMELMAETVLRNSASTLESLIWSPEFEGTVEHPGFSFQNGPIQFPRLRKFWSKLELYDGINISLDALGNFLVAPLESFGPSSSICEIMLENGLERKYPLPSLRTFAITEVYTCIPDTRSVPSTLRLAAKYASHIRELFLLRTAEAPHLENHVRCENYANLRSLCFVWPEEGKRLLGAIGSHLPTLEELAFNLEPCASKTNVLFVWTGSGLRPCLSHTEIVKMLSPLKKLARLAIFGDEYIADYCGPEWSWHYFFKDYVWFHQCRGDVGATRYRQIFHLGPSCPGDEVEDFNTRWLEESFIDSHLHSKPAELATRYAEELPSLRQFVIGRVLVEVSRTDSGEDST